MMISTVSRFSTACIPTGIPRPLSMTVTELSRWMTTWMRSQCPAWASSTALSRSSKTMWCRPVPSSVSPMYMPGRFRTASSPFSSLMLSEVYSLLIPFCGPLLDGWRGRLEAREGYRVIGIRT